MTSLGYDTLIAQRVNQLQYFQKREVLDFVNYLLTKSTNISQKNDITFAWEGALKKAFANTNSVELQHKIWDLE